MEDNLKLKKLYQNAKEIGFEMPSFEQFATDMQDSVKRNRMYDSMSEVWEEMPTREEFAQDMAFDTPQQSQSKRESQIQQQSPQQKKSEGLWTRMQKIGKTFTEISPEMEGVVKGGEKIAKGVHAHHDDKSSKNLSEEQKNRMAGEVRNLVNAATKDDTLKDLEWLSKRNPLGNAHNYFNEDANKPYRVKENYNPYTGKYEKTYRVPSYVTDKDGNVQMAEMIETPRLSEAIILSDQWRRNITDLNNAAEKAWSDAGARTAEADEKSAEGIFKNSWLGGREMRMSNAGEFASARSANYMKEHDLDKLLDDAWNNLGSQKQNEMKNYYYRILESKYPGADANELGKAAEEMARQQSDTKMYDVAVKKNLPKSNLEYLFRKIAEGNSLLQLQQGFARSMAGTTGDLAAREQAEQMYGKNHKVTDIAGTVLGFATDPLTILSAGAGSTAAKGTAWLGGKVMAGKGATKLATDAATRKFSSTLGGRIIMGMTGGAGNFGAYEFGKEGLNQFVHGGYINPETGENEGYKFGEMLKSGGHGLAMGGATGWIAPAAGRLSDRMARATNSTIGKIGVRAGQLGGTILAEGTIFSIPEWAEGSRDAFDVWTDNLAMMAGFKGMGAVKSAAHVIDDMFSKESRVGFETKLRSRLDGRPELGLTNSETRELKEHGYDDLNELVRDMESADEMNAKRNASTRDLVNEKDAGAGVEEIGTRLKDMMQDTTISEAARAKMYYLATGRMVPMSTVISCSMERDGNGYVVNTYGVNGIITSRRHRTAKGARAEVLRNNRQIELNFVDTGERYTDSMSAERRAESAAEDFLKTHEEFTDKSEVLRMYKIYKDIKPEERTENEQRFVDDMDAAFKMHEGETSSEIIRREVGEEFGVDIDKVIAKEPKRRSNTEQQAVVEYTRRLFPEDAFKVNEEGGESTSGSNGPRLTGPEDGADSEINAAANNIAQASRAAYERGREVSDPKVMAEVRYTADYYATKLREEFADVAEDQELEFLEEMGDGDALDGVVWINQSDNFTPQQKKAAMDYYNARSEWDGMIDTVKEDAEDAMQRAFDEIDKNADPTGMVHPAAIRDGSEEGRSVNIIGGHVASENGVVSVENSDASIVVRDAQTGKVSMIPASDIISVGEDVSADDLKNEVRRRTESEMMDKADVIDGTRGAVMSGNTYTYIDDMQQPHEVNVLAVDENQGIAQVVYDGEQNTIRLDDLNAGIQRGYESETIARLNEENGEMEAAPAENVENAGEDIVTEGDMEGTPSTETDKELLMSDDKFEELLEKGSSEDIRKEADALKESLQEGGTVFNAVADAEKAYAAAQNNGSVSEETKEALKELIQDYRNVMSITEDRQKKLSEKLTAMQPAEEPAETAAAAEPVAEEPVVERVPKDEKGNPLYMKAKVEDTLADIYDKLDTSETAEFIDANIKVHSDALKKLNAKKPKITADINKTVATKKEWNEKKKAAEEGIAYWNEVKKQHESITNTQEITTESADDVIENEEPIDAREYISGLLGRSIKITPESFKAEGCGGTEEMRSMPGVIAKEGKGGISIDRASEELAESGQLVQYGISDDADIRDMLIDVLSDGNPRGYIKRHRAELRKQEEEQQLNELENFARKNFGMSAEDYLAYEETMLPLQMAKYKDADTDRLIAEFNDNKNNTGNGTERTEGADTTAADTRTDGSSEVLQTEQPADAARIGNGKVDEQGRREQDGGEVPDTTEAAQETAEVNEKGYISDKSGNPLTLYHGTQSKDITAASQLESGHRRADGEKAQFNGDGISFTPDESVARDYSDGGSVVKARVKLKKPYVTYGIANMTEDEARAFSDKLKAEGYDGIVVYASKAMRDADSLPIEVVALDKKSIEDIVEDGSDDDLSFREGDEEDKSLVGIHNISEDKLRKAVKMGGLANPSAAVIDIDRQNHEGYGEISLVLPSSMVDKKTGRNAGTYTGDAWTPTYPQIQRQIDGEGKERMRKDVEGMPEIMRDAIRQSMNSFEYQGDADGLAYMYLTEKGITPEISKMKGVYPKETQDAVAKIMDGKTAKDLTDDDYDKLFDLFIKEKFGGDNAKHDNLVKTRIGVLENKINKNSFANDMFAQIAQRELNELKELGYNSQHVYDFARGVADDSRRAGAPDTQTTKLNAVKYVDDNGMREDFEKWKQDLDDRYGIKEVIFDGFTPSGRRRYLPHTIENVSKFMNKQGKTNSYDDTGLSATHSMLIKRLASLDQIRKNKVRLADGKDYQQKYDELDERYQNVVSSLSDRKKISDNPFTNMDYAAIRLQEAIKSKNPVEYLNNEYKYDLDEEFAKELNQLIKDIKALPSKYFETKFERPVKLNEFAAAVVPEGTSEDVIKALENSGLKIYKYDRDKEGSRREAILNATEEDGIRFRESEDNDIFYSNAEHAVENIKQNKATPEQWLKMIEKNGGLKAGEDKWLGLGDWLKNSDAKTLTKDEVLDYIKSNEIQMEEVDYMEKRDPSKVMRDLYGEDIYEKYEISGEGDNMKVWFIDFGDAAEFYNKHHEDQITEFNDSDKQKLRAYGNEILENVKKEIAKDKLMKEINFTRLDYTTRHLRNKREIALTVPTIDSWNEKDEIHFGDAGEGRAVAWARFGETTDADGNRVLVIDEVQSKRHQEGREKGYHTGKVYTREDFNKEVERLSNEMKDIEKAVVERNNIKEVFGSEVNRFGTEEEKKKYHELSRELGTLVLNRNFDNLSEKVPDAPFDKNWSELAMKRMLRYAAENGYDKVAWTTGMQQAERYDLGHFIDSIRCDDIDEDNVRTWRVFFKGTMDGGEISADNNGTIKKSSIDGLMGKNLSEAVGKEVAEKMLEMDIDEKLEAKNSNFVGGSGMKAFYDKMIPSFMNKYVKKWGTKVEDVTLPELNEADQVMHSVEVTPEMKESVMQGQPLFRFIGEKGAKNLDKAEEATTRLDNLKVARNMERAKKDAKAIKMATGWERGKDGKWRYETKDFDNFDPYGNSQWLKSNPEYGRYRELNKKLGDHVFFDGEPLTEAESAEQKKLYEKYKHYDLTKTQRNPDALTVSDFVDDKDLFTAYPDIADIKIKIEDLKGGTQGSYNSDGTLTLDKGMVERAQGLRVSDKEYMRSVFIHEIQHAIQHREGFAEGGSTATVRWKMQRLLDKMGDDADYAQTLKDIDLNISSAKNKLKQSRRWFKNPKNFMKSSEQYMYSTDKIKHGQELAHDYYWDVINDMANGYYDDYMSDDEKKIIHIHLENEKESKDSAKEGWHVDMALDILDRAEKEIGKQFKKYVDKNIITEYERLKKLYDEKDIFQLYQAIAGEVEARNAQARKDMSPEERRKSLATETEDVAREDQIILQDSLGMSESTSGELDKKYPGWLEGQTTKTGQHTTQIATTVNTYKKIGEWLKANGYKDVRILDASSGLGKGTQALRDMGFDVEDVEPYPSENREKPTYGSYDDVKGKYDVVISNAVLNVIPDDWRKDVLHKMADKVADGGTMIINVRDAKEIEKQKQKIELDSPSEILVTDKKGDIHAYQKGFTQQELKDYVEGELGEGWKVETANEKNSGIKGRAIVATKGDKVSPDDVTKRKRDKMRESAKKLAEELNVPIEIIEDVKDIKSSNAAKQRKMRHAKGWFDPKTGNVVIVLPNNTDIDDIKESVFHEIVGHRGLRELVGEENFSKFLDEVYDHCEDEIKEKIDAKAEKKKWSRQKATDEYLAHLAEKGFDDFTKAERSLWQKIKELVLKAIDKFLTTLHLPKHIKLGDNELRYMLWRSYNKLKFGKEDMFQAAKDVVKRRNLKVGEFATASAFRPMGNEKESLGTGEQSKKTTIATAIPSDSGAKILKNLDAAVKNYEKIEGKHNTRSFIGEISDILDLHKTGSSHYGLFETVNGKTLSIRLSNHNATVSNFDKNGEKEGLSIIVSRLSNKGIKNDGDAHILEYFYADKDLNKADGKPLAEIIKSIKQALYSGKYVDKTGLAQKEEVNNPYDDILYSLKDNKSLVGIHNIPEDKLRLALKQGGLANPSVAVVDIDKQSHEDYGEISLIMPSSLIESSAGTFVDDAWTPRYPYVIHEKGEKTDELINGFAGKFDKKLRPYIENCMRNYVHSAGEDNRSVAYAFLAEKGIAPESTPLLSQEEIQFIDNINTENISEKDFEKLKDILAKIMYDGNRDLLDKNMAGMSNSSKQILDMYVEYVKQTVRQQGNIDFKTLSEKSWDVVTDRELVEELVKWRDETLARELGLTDKLVHLDKDGKMETADNTLENASRFMNEEGLLNTYNVRTPSAMRSSMFGKMKTLDDIRDKKDLLGGTGMSEEEKEETRDAFRRFQNLSDDLWLIQNRQVKKEGKKPDAYDMGTMILESLKEKNPVAYLESKVGVDLSNEKKFVADLEEHIDALKNAKSRYFETKFDRPVYLNEFAAAVVPYGTSSDITKALEDMGLKVYKYDPYEEGSRRKATIEASDDDNILFRFIGEYGAKRLDEAEESTTRLDNLRTAREMEKAGKDAKTIKLATGWERGKDERWKYETPDFKLKKNWRDAKTLGELIEDKELFTAYPRFRDLTLVSVKDDADSSSGYYEAGRMPMDFSNGPVTEIPKWIPGKITAEGTDLQTMKQSLAHEIQHAIQENENFAQGGNQGMFYSEMLHNHDESYNKYKSLAGEVEARNVESRIDMTPEERIRSLAEETEDVAREDQIILINGVLHGKQMREDEDLFFREGDEELSEEETEKEKNLNKAETFEQALTDAMLKLASNHSESKKIKEDALNNVKATIGGIHRAMSIQKKYDKSTVKDLTTLVTSLVKNKMIRNMTAGQVMAVVRNLNAANGRESIREYANKLVDIVLKTLIRESSEDLDKLTKVKAKKNQTGVSVIGRLEEFGQTFVTAFRKAALDKNSRMSAESINEEIDRLYDRIYDKEKVGDEAAAELMKAGIAGYEMALKYMENVDASMEEETSLRNERRQADEDKHSGKITAEQYDELVNSIDTAIHDNMLERVKAMHEIMNNISELMSSSHDEAKKYAEEQIERVKEIHHNANSDMEGRPAIGQPKRMKAFDKFVNSDIARLFLSPLATFDQMLRLFGSKSADGHGYLYNRFVPQILKASGNEFNGLLDAKAKLDEKVSDVFGKDNMKWSDLYNLGSKKSTIHLEFVENGEKKDHVLTQGNALYIYAVNKMTDGKMKLRKMGISEEDVDKIEEQLDPKFIELMDWVQDEFLPQMRAKYNDVHKRLFGVSMATIDNYFPLRALKSEIKKDTDINQEETDMLPSTATGAIIKRTRNTKPLNIMGTDAFSTVIEHIEEMEHWAAFAEVSRDLNTLLNYNKFANKVKAIQSPRFGTGETIWNNFKNVAKIAVGSYQPKLSRYGIDKAAVNLAKGVTGAKISFRVFTALKQLLSYPAYFANTNPWYLAKATMTPSTSWNWAMENLPLFKKRWKSRHAGDQRLDKSDLDWHLWSNAMIEKLGRWGMSPNAFIDGLTVAMGSKAIYDTAYSNFINQGFSEEQAHEKAVDEAAISYNQTQQSNEGSFLSPVQMDRTLFSVAFTVFRNSSMGYQRQLAEAISQLNKMTKPEYRTESINFMAKQLEREGLDEESARSAAKKKFNHAAHKYMASLAIFGFVMQFAWNMGPYLVYILMGDNDEEKEKLLDDAMIHSLFGGVEGLTAGNVMSDNLNKFVQGEPLRNFSLNMLPLASDIEKLVKAMGYDKVQGLNELFNLVAQSAIGVNPQTITDVMAAFMDAAEGDIKEASEMAMFALRLINAPQTQIDKVYADKIRESINGESSKTINELAKRYAAYKVLRGTPVTKFLYNDDEETMALSKKEDKFKGIAKEKILSYGDKDVNENYNLNLDEFEELKTKAAAINERANAEEEMKFDLSPEGMFYNMMSISKNKIDEVVNGMFDERETKKLQEHLDEISKLKKAALDNVEFQKTGKLPYSDDENLYNDILIMHGVMQRIKKDFDLNGDKEGWKQYKKDHEFGSEYNRTDRYINSISSLESAKKRVSESQKKRLDKKIEFLKETLVRHYK